MRNAEEIKALVLEYVADDPLYAIIKDTPQEEILFTDDYLKDIIEKKGYAMLDIAEWFDISDGQLRYYLRPFHDYIFEENGVVTNTTNNVLRLNLRAILKLRMIILLKDEYRVKGLKQELGLDGEGYITKHFQRAASPINNNEVARLDDGNYEDLIEQIGFLTKVIEEMLNTGVFKRIQSEDGLKIVQNDDYFDQRLKLIVDSSKEEIEGSSRKELELKEEKLNERLNEVELLKKDYERRLGDLERAAQSDSDSVATKLDKIEQMDKLRVAALEEWSKNNKYGIWAKLTRSDQIEVEKEQFVKEYISKQLND